MATFASLNARLDRLKEQMEQTAGNRCLRVLFVHPGEKYDEAIARQKRELGVTDDDRCIVVQFVNARDGSR